MFQLFKGGKEHQSNVGENVENKQKNRFRNMVACKFNYCYVKNFRCQNYASNIYNVPKLCQIAINLIVNLWLKVCDNVAREHCFYG